MDWHRFKTTGLKSSRIFAAVLCCSLCVWLIMELLRDRDSFIYWFSSDLAGASITKIMMVMIIALAITFLGIGTPVLFILWFYKKLYANARRGDARLPLYKVFATDWKEPAGLFILWLLCLAPFYMLIEAVATLPMTPRTMLVCAMLVTMPAYKMIKTTVPARRCMMIALVVAGVLATNYADRDPGKYSLRDRLRLRTEVPVIMVEKIMTSPGTNRK
jgi:hypothetical protein